LKVVALMLSSRHDNLYHRIIWGEGSGILLVYSVRWEMQAQYEEYDD
jgi:hypothetical protein